MSFVESTKGVALEVVIAIGTFISWSLPHLTIGDINSWFNISKDNLALISTGLIMLSAAFRVAYNYVKMKHALNKKKHFENNKKSYFHK
jgi:hypothetical protein